MPKKKSKTVEEKVPALSDNAAGATADKKAIDVAIKALQKKFGQEVVNWLDKIPEEDLKVIPTGSIGLDAALGVGGFVRGRIYELYGPHSSGKTTLALSAIREVQRAGGHAAFVDAEHTLSTELLLKMGIDLSKITLVRGYTGEQNLDLAKGLIATGKFSICVVDSISALQPAAEANLGSFSDQTIGLHPRLMSRMSRDLTPIVSRTNTALLLINQIRSNIGGYGNPETTSGGNALQHHYSGRIRVTGGAVKSRQIQDSKGVVIGHRVSFEITKNKLALPFKKAETDLFYGTGFHFNGELVDLGVDMGFIDQAGSWFTYEGERLQGRDKFVMFIGANDELRDKLTNQVKQMLGFGENNEPVVRSGDSDS